MRIAMIGQKGIPALWGGVERHVEELSTGLVSRGHNVTVYGRGWYTRAAQNGTTTPLMHTYKGVHIVYVPSIRTKHLDTISHVLGATFHALFQHYDIIHYHGVGPSLLAWIPRVLCPRTKIIATFHSPDRLHGKWGTIAKLVLTWGEWASCHFAHETITVSQTLQRYAADTYKVPTIYIPNGVTLQEDCARITNMENILRGFNVRAGRYVVIMARFVSHKGIHLALEAWRRALRDYPTRMRGLRLVVIGDEQGEREYAQAIRRMAKKIPHVILTGWQNTDTVHTLLSQSLMFVQPSQSEGMPLSVLEAMSHGKPVIASDLPEHRELVTDSRFRYETHKISTLEERLVWTIANPEIARVEGLKNRERVERFYQWKTIVRHIEHIYTDAVFNREWNWRGVAVSAE